MMKSGLEIFTSEKTILQYIPNAIGPDIYKNLIF